MKKVKLIGALMAAVLAAAPVTGLTSIPAFSNNAIVAEAAGSLIMVEPGNCKQTSLYTFDLSQTKNTVLMKNGGYSLIAEPSGRLYIYNNNTKKVVKYLMNYSYKGKTYPGTNSVISKLRIAFQPDGNIVCYAVFGNTVRPLYHSRTYYTKTCMNSTCCYYYFLEADGRLVIDQLYSGTNEIFDSARCNFVRLV